MAQIELRKDKRYYITWTDGVECAVGFKTEKEARMHLPYHLREVSCNPNYRNQTTHETRPQRPVSGRGRPVVR